MVKERESFECDITLDMYKDDILSLQEKYRELDRKYNEILKEIKKQ